MPKPIPARISRAQRRQRRQQRRYILLGAAALGVLLLAFVITKAIETVFQKGKPPVSGPAASAAALPWKATGPMPQIANFTIVAPDARTLGLVPNGRVDAVYFDNAMLLGDSLTLGFKDFKKFPPERILAYKGISPQGFEGVQKDDTGKQIKPLDIIAAANPGKLYIMLGTNSLIGMKDEAFIFYYGQLIDQLRQRVPAVQIYVQSILPVSAEKAAAQPTLNNERIRLVNNLLAKMASEKGVYFLNLQEVYTAADGSMDPAYLYSLKEGVHLKPTGYDPWLDYMYTHVAHRPGNPYLPGSPLYIPPAPPAPPAAASAAGAASK